jgi:hypothetical protein
MAMEAAVAGGQPTPMVDMVVAVQATHAAALVEVRVLETVKMARIILEAVAELAHRVDLLEEAAEQVL